MLSINGTPLSRVESTQFLGGYVDQHMTWKDHIKSISSKIAKNTGIIARTAHILPPSIRLKLYYSLIYPYLAYCNLVWASTYTTRLKRHNFLKTGDPYSDWYYLWISYQPSIF